MGRDASKVGPDKCSDMELQREAGSHLEELSDAGNYKLVGNSLESAELLTEP